jgi:hypothetical protein
MPRDHRRLLAQRADARARLGRLVLADQPLHFGVTDRAQPLAVQRRGAGQHLVEQHAQ